MVFVEILHRERKKGHVEKTDIARYASGGEGFR